MRNLNCCRNVLPFPSFLFFVVTGSVVVRRLIVREVNVLLLRMIYDFVANVINLFMSLLWNGLELDCRLQVIVGAWRVSWFASKMSQNNNIWIGIFIGTIFVLVAPRFLYRPFLPFIDDFGFGFFGVFSFLILSSVDFWILGLKVIDEALKIHVLQTRRI